MRSSPCSASFPVTWPFLDEGSHAFFLVLGAEQSMEQAALEADALAEGDFKGSVNHFLDGNRRDRRHPGNRFGSLQCLIEKVSGRYDSCNEARALRLRSVHHPARKAHF